MRKFNFANFYVGFKYSSVACKLNYWKTKLLRNVFLQFSIVFSFLMLSCNDDNQVFDSYASVDKSGWHKDSIASFELPVMDSLKPYHLYFNIRNTNDYKYSNLYLITAIDFPNGKKLIDTLEYKMAEANGEWLGTGMTSIKENKLWFKQSFKFNEKGTYNVSVRHAMRSNGAEKGILFLKGITDIGFRVETKETH